MEETEGGMEGMSIELAGEEAELSRDAKFWDREPIAINTPAHFRAIAQVNFKSQTARKELSFVLKKKRKRKKKEKKKKERKNE